MRKPKSVNVVSDLHMPSMNPELLLKLVEKYKNQATEPPYTIEIVREIPANLKKKHKGKKQC